MNTDLAAALSPMANAALDVIGLAVMGFCPMDLASVQFPAVCPDSEVRTVLRHPRRPTSESKGHSKSMILVPLFEPEVRTRTRGTVDANFGFGALVQSSYAIVTVIQGP